MGFVARLGYDFLVCTATLTMKIFGLPYLLCSWLIILSSFLLVFRIYDSLLPWNDYSPPAFFHFRNALHLWIPQNFLLTPTGINLPSSFWYMIYYNKPMQCTCFWKFKLSPHLTHTLSRFLAFLTFLLLIHPLLIILVLIIPNKLQCRQLLNLSF